MLFRTAEASLSVCSRLLYPLLQKQLTSHIIWKNKYLNVHSTVASTVLTTGLCSYCALLLSQIPVVRRGDSRVSLSISILEVTPIWVLHLRGFFADICCPKEWRYLPNHIPVFLLIFLTSTLKLLICSFSFLWPWM